MPVVLGAPLTCGTRVMRTGGTLQYHDKDVPLRERLLVGQVRALATDLVLPDGSVVTILAEDMTGNFTVIEGPVLDSDEFEARQALLSRSQELIGEPIEPRARMLVKRTGRPFWAMHNHSAPSDNPLLLSEFPHEYLVGYDDKELFVHGFVPVQYFTTAYFVVLAQSVPEADDVVEWMTGLRAGILHRRIVRADLEPQLALYGISPATEIQDYWLKYLNDPSVDLKDLLAHISRLTNIFAEPPSIRAETLEELRVEADYTLCRILSAAPDNGWRRQLIRIGLVLDNPKLFSAGALLAALYGLNQFRP